MEKYNCQYLFGLINDISLRNIYYGKVIFSYRSLILNGFFFKKYSVFCVIIQLLYNNNCIIIVAVMAVAVKGALHVNENNS